MTYIERIIDVTTNEVTEREYTDAENAQVKSAILKAQTEAKELADKQAAKLAAETKLSALGLTGDDLKALGL